MSLDLIQFCLVVIIISIIVLVSRRHLVAIINTYSFQSFFLSLMIFLLFLRTKNIVLLYTSILTFASKCFFIPYILKKSQKSINIHTDIEYNLFAPSSSVFLSMVLVGAAYFSFEVLRKELGLGFTEYLGVIFGISSLFMGMLIISARKKVITKIVGYLTMENGVILLGVFVEELPFLIEILILIDLLVLLYISSLLAFGMDSSVESFHAKLNPFGKWFNKVVEK